MKLLLVKTSSMGDVIHTLPALTDAHRVAPGLSVDWVVEESLKEIPAWHKAVKHVIPIALRRWRKRPFALSTIREFKRFCRQLREVNYDLVIDAQGLLKSAAITSLARANNKIGFNRHSAREPISSFFYSEGFAVEKKQHAITRLRILFSKALHYSFNDNDVAYGLRQNLFTVSDFTPPYVVFLHGTTWASKNWPEAYWRELAERFLQKGLMIKISGGNPHEVRRAERIASGLPNIEVLPYLKIHEMANLLFASVGAIAVDTGFAHLAAMLNKPLITLYGATSPALTGALSSKARNLVAGSLSCSPCFKRECYIRDSRIRPACFEELSPKKILDEFSILL